MDQSAVQRFKFALQSKSTHELLQIYLTNDTEEYRPEAFDAIRQILSERDIVPGVPAQKPETRAQEPPRPVVITDIQIPFKSMVNIALLWAFCYIFAFFIAGIIAVALLSLLE